MGQLGIAPQASLVYARRALTEYKAAMRDCLKLSGMFPESPEAEQAREMLPQLEANYRSQQESAALRVPSVVISTGDNPARWAPINCHLHRVLCQEGGVAVEEVHQSALQLTERTESKPPQARERIVCES